MDENHQDKTESKKTATEETLPPSSSKNQSKPEYQAQSHAGKAVTNPFNIKAIHLLLAIALSIAMVGVIVLIYLWFRLNWQLWSLILLTLVGILLLIFLIREGYYPQWTGFRGYVKETKEYTDGQSTTTTRDQQPGKTLWDWLQLLIIPIVLASATLGFGLWQAQLAQQQHDNDQKIATLQHETDEQIAADQQREMTLKDYLDQMSGLLLNNKLRDSKPEDEVRQVARARTLTALRRLDTKRKAILLRFLYESNLILKNHAIVDLRGTDLTDTDLTDTDLSDADLSGADLSDAILNGANLSDTTMKGTILNGAKLQNAFLIDADLSPLIIHSLAVVTAYNFALLENADLKGAHLDHADLIFANLSTAQNLTQQQLNDVRSCKFATLPQGLTCNQTAYP